LVFIKTKSNQIEIIFLKKNQNRFKPTGFGSVRFGFLEQKPVQTGLVWFFLFGSVLARFFSSLAWFWLGLARFFFVFFSLGSVQFFQFQTCKIETDRTGRFF
jgi:hypothetical protein